MRLSVRYLDGSKAEVVVTASARRAFESKHQTSVLAAVQSGLSYWADELAHSSLVQTTVEAREFDAWLDAVETIKLEVPEESGARPTGGAAKGPSRAGSSKRPSTRAKTSKV